MSDRRPGRPDAAAADVDRRRDRELERAAVGTEVLSQVRGHRSTVAWDDLDRPADIVSRIGRQFGLSIAGLEQIPHDLWAGATIPKATASEALSLVLNQFDLTFEWLPRESGVRLVPVPERVAIERSYTLRGKSASQTLRTLHSLIEGLDATARGNKLVVRGTLEQHEMVAAATPRPKNAQPTLTKKSVLPVEKESFKLQAEGVSLQELFEELKKQGLPLEYNARDAERRHRLGPQGLRRSAAVAGGRVSTSAARSARIDLPLRARRGL